MLPLARFACCFIVLSGFLSGLTGCLNPPALYIRDRMHEPPPKIAPPITGTTPDLLLTNRVQRNDPANYANFATVEFLKNGELADDCKLPHKERPCQRPYAIDFLKRARVAAGTKRLNVIVFIHGNENWADDHSDNYQHFRQLLNCLNMGTEAYQGSKKARLYNIHKEPRSRKSGGMQYRESEDVSEKTVLTCEGIPPQGNNLYVGIFLGWRGALNATDVNVSERTAYRISQNGAKIGQNGALENLLFDLRDEVKTDDPNTSARFMVFGHSYGGLILERTAIRMYKPALLEKNPTMPCPDDPSRTGVPPFSDLMIAIAPAEDAVPAKSLVEDFQTFAARQTQANEDSFCGSKALAPSLYRPLMISFLSKKDNWSYRAGAWGRHTFSGEAGRDKFTLFRQKANSQEEETRDTWVADETAANLPYFHTLCDLSSHHYSSTHHGGQEGDFVCNAEWKAAFMGDDPKGMAMLRPEGLAFVKAKEQPEDSPIRHLYVRWNCKTAADQALPQTNTGASVPCTTEQPYNTREDLDIWNETPFWIAALDLDIYKDHSGFWKSSFV